MAIPRNLANLANQLDTSGNPPKVQVGDSSVVVTDTGSNGTIAFTTDNSERMRITSAGNVGIGTNAPSTLLHIASSAASYTPILTIDNTNTGAYAGKIQFKANYSGSGYTPALIAAYGGSSASDGTLAFETAGSERMRINSDGTIKTSSTISVGGATPTTSGAGITFPATQSASTDANTLDDYEEGTFTPTMFGTSSAGTTTYTTQIGNYTKIGRVVYFQIDVAWSNATGTGNIKLGGLPFTCQTQNANNMLSTDNITLTSNYYASMFQIETSGTSGAVYQAGTTGSALANIPMDTAGRMWSGGFYYTS